MKNFDASYFRQLTKDEKEKALATLSDSECEELLYDWDFWARDKQRTPDGNWSNWLILAGRGFGKTRVGAEWVRQQARRYRYVNLIGATSDDARDIMIDGESGIMAVCPRDERPIYKAHVRALFWPSGCKSLVFTADEPERLRGKQHEKLWADELCAWRYPASWDQAMFGLRLGDNPQACITTTPKPTKIIRELMNDPATFVTRGSSDENRNNLAPKFFDTIISRYAGTRLERQERYAEILDDNPNALWSRSNIDFHRVLRPPADIVRVVIGIDPAVTSNEDSDETGIVVCCRDRAGHGYVLDDLSCVEKPDKWAAVAVSALDRHSGDRIVAEVNNGGDMVESVLRTVRRRIPYKAVRASRGKAIRAEPISSLYEQGLIHHVGAFPQLEDQLCEWNPSESGKSPDRLDALVWAFTELFSSNICKPVVAGSRNFSNTSRVPTHLR